jgi:hypothetical protein
MPSTPSCPAGSNSDDIFYMSGTPKTQTAMERPIPMRTPHWNKLRLSITEWASDAHKLTLYLMAPETAANASSMTTNG